jgi:phospholipid transport system substrate-binding protein
MMHRIRSLGPLLGIALLLATAMAPAAGSAESYVRGRQGDLVSLLSQPKSAAREEKIGAIMDQVFDYDELAKRSLGNDWDARSDSERQEFQGLLERLVKQAYRKHLAKTVGWEVSYNPSTNIPDGVRVPTVATHKTDKRKEPVGVDYLLHEVKGQWKVFDVVIEGSSLVSNYNSQFRKIIRKQGFGELITRMKRRLEKNKD